MSIDELRLQWEASYDQETDEFQRDVDMFIDGLDSD